ncbi:MAG: hypothetical protein ACYSUP_04760 [Planctomycetota bacterium]
MKKMRFSVALILLLAASISFAKYSGGTGEPNDPYRIATAEDLNDIGNHVEDFNKCFVMVNDINLGAYTGQRFKIIGEDFQKPFTGIFDGNDHTISNFCWSLQGSYARYIGIFGVLDGWAVVENLHMENVDVNALPSSDFVGPVVGFNYIGRVVNCSASGRMQGSHDLGGLVGRNERHVIDCWADVDVLGGHSASGGLIGVNALGTVLNCHSLGDVYGVDFVGGLVGGTCAGRIEDCWAVGSVIGAERVGGLGGDVDGPVRRCWANCIVEGIQHVGGLAGFHRFRNVISDSYAISSVRGDSQVGGLAGTVGTDSSTDYCYAAGPVDGNSYVGGLVGYKQSSSYTDCFWDRDINPDVNGIGNANDPNVVGKTTAEMMTESTFTDSGWDFVEVWDIGEHQTYPFLRVHPAGDMNHDGIVDWRDFAILAGHWLEGL